MKKLVVLLLMLHILCLRIFAQTNESFVGVNGKKRTYVEITIPLSRSIPPQLDSLLAKSLFDVPDKTVREAYKDYKSQYSETMSATRDNISKAGKCHDAFELTWLLYVDGCYASFVVKALRVQKDGTKTRNRNSAILYDLKHKRILRLDDVFSLTTLSEINKLGGTMYQMYMKRAGTLILQFRKAGRLMQAEFTATENKDAFSSSFLELMNQSLASTKETPQSVQEDVSVSINTDEVGSRMGYMLYRNKDYKNALPYLQKEANRGIPKSQYALAWMYSNGEGVEKNSLQAYHWYHESAKQGYVPSQYNLALWYEKGGNYKNALEWLTKAAEKGHPSAFNALGYYYQEGRVVAQDYKKAMSNYETAAAKGNYYAMNNIGVLYMSGLGVEKDFKKAAEWFEKALQKDPTYATAKKNLERVEASLKPETPVEKPAEDNNLKAKPANRNLFVVVIGNEKYEEEADVPYAENDAKEFKDYCIQTLGVTENHLRYIPNAGYNDMRRAVNWLKQGMDTYDGEGSAIFYYAGHGIPDESQKSAYLLPVDGEGSDVASGYPLSELYEVLGNMPARSVMIFLDACFSGTKRDGTMMASARGVAIKVKKETPKGKLVVFTASQNDETAYPFAAQKHGMFTYYLLRKLKDSKGNVTLGELANYVTREVKRQSFDKNKKRQTPTVMASPMLGESWKNLKLK